MAGMTRTTRTKKQRKGFDDALALLDRPCIWGQKHPSEPCAKTFRSGYENATYCPEHQAQSRYDYAVTVVSDAIVKVTEAKEGVTAKDVWASLTRDVTAELKDRQAKRDQAAQPVQSVTVDPDALKAFLATNPDALTALLAQATGQATEAPLDR